MQLFHNTVIKPLLEKSRFGSQEEGDFRLLGWNIKTKENGEISFRQKDYLKEKINRLDMSKLLHHKLDDDQSSKLRAAVGLSWMGDGTRPCVSFSRLVLTCNQNNFTHRDMKTYNAAVNAIRKDLYSIIVRRLKPNNWRLSLFFDASYGNLPPEGMGTGGGFLILL